MNAQREVLARRMGLAWALGVDTLYKFKAFQGDQREHIRELLEHSRVYFSAPDQFNDPYDVAPVVALGGDRNDAAFLSELDAHERAKLKSLGHSDAQIDAYRKERGVNIDRLADETRGDLRRKLSETRIFCLTAERCHPLQWAHYADHHRGLCLHFRCAPGTTIGLARQVKYRGARAPIFIPLNRQSADDIMERLVLVKADFWSYEKEYRIIADDSVAWGGKLDGPFVQLEKDALTGVTVGLRMPEAERAELLAMVDLYRPGLPVWEAIEDYSRFWMQVRLLPSPAMTTAGAS